MFLWVISDRRRNPRWSGKLNLRTFRLISIEMHFARASEVLTNITYLCDVAESVSYELLTSLNKKLKWLNFFQAIFCSPASDSQSDFIMLQLYVLLRIFTIMYQKNKQDTTKSSKILQQTWITMFFHAILFSW